MDSKNILKDLVSFNTINDKENKEIINYIENYLKKLGFKTDYKSKCLVMSNEEECDIGFLGHTDTVSCSDDWNRDPFVLREEDGKLYGLGSCDMKGSIAVILSVISKIDFSKRNKGMKFIFTYDEEIGFFGINELINKRITFPSNMIIGEPTNNEIINASKGLLELKVSFKGVSSHSSKPEEGVNAIENCISFINDLKKYYNKLKKEAIDSKYTTMNIGVINGGRSINIVPDNCDVLIDFRTVSENQNRKIVSKINKLISKYDARSEIVNDIKPFLNVTGETNMSDFITEASFIDSKNKCILGVGPVNAHKKNEFITIDSIKKLEEQYKELIEKNI